MRWLSTVRRELFGLFIEDGSFALAILAWVVGGMVCVHLFDVPPLAESFLLAAGLALLLAENVDRTARQARDR